MNSQVLSFGTSDLQAALPFIPGNTTNHSHSVGSRTIDTDPSEEEPEEEVEIFDDKKKKAVPPLNFALVENGIFRSGHPMPINFDFLASLRLKTIIYLGDKEDNTAYYEWIESQGINFKYFRMESVSEPFKANNPEALTNALHLILDSTNYPILIHSNKGKHRIGVLVGLMRKLLQGWALSGIFDEYDRYAAGKGEGDLEFIEIFQPVLEYEERCKPGFLRTY
ncbi:hypothetical protein BABINDRAFT_161562 [Babjeviella inositovora NRRL Y-12698]|uniref:Uncharacterized protein n=1 Tax=Babjeviella inositovora NRRL Y-12698 TaxID=984486 RepID=A0A1E3QS90_9ASCO|nr:uncharacterized protein BABINDRAFT_161562 [Babjeviella inositovora NRRL Y-12698]ODQ79892.1 hypothetical protein BABINDRAFT_161562 [Babjeviella inositovora NRRL Y-12698]